MASRKIALQALQSFIRNGLRKKLTKDLLDHRIFREADLETCAYYHLRWHLRLDPAWIILARKHAPQMKRKRFVDLLVFRDKSPQLALELKWNRAHISRKDHKVLDEALTLGVKKAYFMVTCMRRAGYEKISEKTDVEKNRLFEVIIYPAFRKSEEAAWKRNRKAFKKAFGKALKAAAA
jgi:hypothetical protein